MAMWNLINKFLYKLTSRYSMWYTFNHSQRDAMSTLERLGVEHGTVRFYGCCHIRVAKGGRMNIGNNFLCQSGPFASIDCQNESKLQVEENGNLVISDNVGMSSIIIHCWNSITIEDHVMIGAGCMIFDTNFHNVDSETRCSTDCRTKVVTAPILIKENAFIGTRCIICKGVTIGKNSVVAAGSVVVKSIPDNEVWGGNPARFIKAMDR